MAKKKQTLKQRIEAIELRLAKHQLYLSIDGELIRRLTEKINGKKRNVGSGVKFKTGKRASK